MKIGIASGLSVAGVIAAGAAAFTLNTAVLSGESAQVSPGIIATTVPGTTGTDGGSVTAADVDVTTNSTQVSDTVTTYNVGTAGSVVIDTSTGTIDVTDIVPASGWTAEPAHTEPDGSVKVHFVKGSARIEFVAAMKSRKVSVSVKNETPAGAGAPGAVNGGLTGPSVAAVPPAGAGTPTRPSIPQTLSGDDDGDDDHHGDREDDDGEFENHDEQDDD